MEERTKHLNEAEIIESQFFAIYLSIIALVQGIALYLLVTQMVEQFEPEFLPKYVFAFMVIFTVWHHYMYGIIYLKWFPSWPDTLLPLLLGIGEMVMIQFTRGFDKGQEKGLVVYLFDRFAWSPHQAWLLSAAFTAFVGALAYFNTYRKMNAHLLCNRMLPNGADAHRAAVRRYYRAICITSACLGINFFLCFRYWPHRIQESVMFGTIALLCHILYYEFVVNRYIGPSFRQAMAEHSMKRKTQLCASCPVRGIFNVDTGSKGDARSNSEVGPQLGASGSEAVCARTGP